MREIVLDTETTGLCNNDVVCRGHRVIEIGCVELVDRKITGREYHTFVKPDRDVDPKAVKIHGLTTKFLSTKPCFKDVVDEFLAFVGGCTLVIHNAPFDMAFLDQELSFVGYPPLTGNVKVVDTLWIARRTLPRIRHTLDSLATFFNVKLARNGSHGAIIDARILSRVYLSMMYTGQSFELRRQHHEDVLTTYIRTKTVFKGRLKDLKDYDTVKIYTYELEKLDRNNGPLLFALRARGEIWYDNNGNFKAVEDGPIDIRLLERTRKPEKIKVPLTDLHRYMRDQLMHVDLDVPEKDIPVYFKAFLKHREEQLDTFFTVDAFSGRIHTPIVNLKHDLREHLTFYGEKLSSLDVKQMQPTILAKVLCESIGPNPFSDAVFTGEDVYDLLMKKDRSLRSRADAKKFVFQLIFGRPSSNMGRMFSGDIRWVDWINRYKSSREPRNPHQKDRHTNLAWLLQYNEVKIMCFVWERLWKKNIPFLTIHDDVLCRPCDRDVVFGVMNEELKKHFKKFSIRVE
jgi:DNA polymerase-3 subunit epsilon